MPTEQDITELSNYRERLRQMMLQDQSYPGGVQEQPSQLQPRLPGPVPVTQAAQIQPIQPELQNFQRSPVVNMPQPVAQPVQQPAPDYSPRQIPTRSLRPAEQEVMSRVPEESHPDSKKKAFLRILGMIGMGAAGIGHGPGGVAQGALEGYNLFGKGPQDARLRSRNYDLTKIQEGIEKPIFDEGYKSAELGRQIGTAQSQDLGRQRTAGIREGELEVKRDEAASKDKDRTVRQKRLQARMEQLPAEFRNMEAINNLPDDQKEAFLDTYLQMHPKETTSEKVQAKIDTEAANLPAIAAASKAKGFATSTGRAEAESSQVTPEMQTSYQDLVKSDPVTAAATLKMLPSGARLKLLNEAGIPASLPQKEQDRLFSSKITLAHVNTARKMATDPSIAKNLGPIAGRIEIIKGRAGTGEPTTLDYSKAMANLNPSDSRKMGEFLNFLNYMVVWESTNLSGTRPAQQLIESLRTTGARASMSQDRLLGSLDAIEKSVKNTMGAILPGQNQENKPDPDGWDWSKIKVH